MKTVASPVTEKPKADATALYNSDIKSIMENKCTPCHFPDKGGFKAPLNDFASTSKYIDDILTRVQLKPTEPGYMPFKGKKDPLTEAEIASLKTWKASLGK